MTLADIGAHLSLTRERVRQIERDALAKLQQRLLGL
jgi:DNA-directed RNA polymerase sigma subunit (sigma70/sigma32)